MFEIEPPNVCSYSIEPLGLYKTSKIERQNSTPFSRYSGETVLNFDPLLRYGMNREFFKGYTAIRVLPYARRHGIYYRST